jgi:hypothetical protein
MTHFKIIQSTIFRQTSFRFFKDIVEQRSQKASKDGTKPKVPVMSQLPVIRAGPKERAGFTPVPSIVTPDK